MPNQVIILLVLYLIYINILYSTLISHPRVYFKTFRSKLVGEETRKKKFCVAFIGVPVDVANREKHASTGRRSATPLRDCQVRRDSAVSRSWTQPDPEAVYLVWDPPWLT